VLHVLTEEDLKQIDDNYKFQGNLVADRVIPALKKLIIYETTQHSKKNNIVEK
jgi:hypothetical protein